LPHASPAWQTLGLKYVFTHKQSPPGSGKTWELVNDAIKISVMAGQSVFIIGPTNEVVLEICNRLASKGVRYNVSLSDQGLAKRLDVDKSNNMAKSVNLGLENLRKRVDFNIYSREFSKIFVMTINKLLSPKWEGNGFYPTTILWDEITLSTTGTFFSVLNKNPSNMITYGDEKQGTPFVSAKFDDEYGVLRSPINLFEIPNSPYHYFIRRAVRMPNPYGEFFLQFFYDLKCSSVLLNAFPELTRYVSFLHHYSTFEARHPTLADGKIFRGKETSWLNDMYDPVYMGDNPVKYDLIVTPYIAQLTLIRAMFPDIRVLTLRPAQGQQAKHVFLDFVRGGYSPFFTNTSMVVAMSRFQLRFAVSFIPLLPSNYVACLMGYDYQDLMTVSDNYESFKSLFMANMRMYPAMFSDDFRPYDHNGDFFLKWWFFLACVERCWVYQMACLGQPSYGFEFTAFRTLAQVGYYKY